MKNRIKKIKYPFSPRSSKKPEASDHPFSPLDGTGLSRRQMSGPTGNWPTVANGGKQAFSISFNSVDSKTEQ